MNKICNLVQITALAMDMRFRSQFVRTCKCSLHQQ